MRELKVHAEVRPNLLGKGARENEMAEGLLSRAGMAEKVFRGEMKDTCAQRERIEEQLVPGFPVPRKGRRTPKPSPDVRWWNTQTGDGASRPVQGRGNPSLAVQKATSLGNGQLPDRNISSHQVVKKKVSANRVGKGRRGRNGKGTEELDELSDEGRRVITNFRESRDDTLRSLVPEPDASVRIGQKPRTGQNRVPFQSQEQRNAVRVVSRISNGNREA
jgi:hypothetical protein